MLYALDTSIVLRLSQPHHPLNSAVKQSIEKLEQNGDEVIVLPQILVEFWAVATRPVNVNGLGSTIEEAETELDNLQKLFTLIPENELIFGEWKRIVTQYKVSGKTTHDVRIAATMQVHKIKHLLTLNAADFKRHIGITAVTPQEILA
jgi:predicted nucleic acid-binding protein